jgi:gluconate 2-dehydrogenase gamma chain
MKARDESRRAFLVGGAAVATAALVPDSPAAAQTPRAKAEAPAAEPLPPSLRHGAFFNDADAATIDAFCERLMPGAPGKAGAREAGVLNYIDLALSGAYSDQREFYRHGLAALDAHCRASYRRGFAQLSAGEQDSVIGALEEGKVETFTWPGAKAFFETLRTHTMEGMFADPIYGGNRNLSGWILVGFPGVQMSFSEADMKSANAFTRTPVTGLQTRAARKREG